MPPVRTVFTSDETDVIRAMQRMQAEMAKLVEENRKLRNESNEQRRSSANSLDSSINQVKGLAASYISVSAAIQLVQEAEERRAKRQKEAAGTQLGAAETQRMFLRNLGAVSAGERSSVLGDIGKISRETGVSQRDLFAAGAEAVSARGNLGNKTTMDAMRMAARFAPENAGEMSAVAGGLLDVASLTKTPDAEKNLGFMIGLQSRVRIANMKAISENLVPAAVSVAGYGGSAAEAAALPAALTMRLKEKTGATSGTAAIALASQLAETLPKLGSTGERIGYMQSHPKEAAEFLKNANFEMKAKGPMAELLTDRGSEIAQIYRENVKAIPGPDQAAGLARGLLGGLDAEKLQQTADLDRRLKQEAEFMELSSDEGRLGVIRENAERVLGKTRNFQSSTTSIYDWQLPESLGGRNPEERLLYNLRRRRGDVEESAVDKATRHQMPYTPEQSQALASIDRMIQLLESGKGINVTPPAPSPRPFANSGLEE